MAQEPQSIGQLSPELERVADQRVGWMGTAWEPQVDEVTDPSDFSRRDVIANRQLMGQSGDIPSMAGYLPPRPMAAEPEHPLAAGARPAGAEDARTVQW